MYILALDLGSTTGFAWGNADTRFPTDVGSKTWATEKELRVMRHDRGDRRGDLRIIRFYDWLTTAHSPLKFDAVVFEDVQFASSLAQTQLWSSFRTTVWLAFPKTLIEAVPVGTLKKFATGFGSASKDAMAAAMERQHPVLLNECSDDNAVDAAWLWLWARLNLSRTKV
jgi:Holliday junction resolvasome RuvABC endonuclease subunit